MTELKQISLTTEHFSMNRKRTFILYNYHLLLYYLKMYFLDGLLLIGISHTELLMNDNVTEAQLEYEKCLLVNSCTGNVNLNYALFESNNESPDKIQQSNHV